MSSGSASYEIGKTKSAIKTVMMARYGVGAFNVAGEAECRGGHKLDAILLCDNVLLNDHVAPPTLVFEYPFAGSAAADTTTHFRCGGSNFTENFPGAFGGRAAVMPSHTALR